MEKETFEQIQTKNDAAIGALSTYLDQTVPKEQFSSIATVRAQNIKPIQYQEDLVSNGLIGEDGLITQKGILHNELKDKGFLSHDGTLTEKATAFVMDEDEALRPENLNYWRIRKGNKIGERDVPWGETFESIGERVWDAVAGLGTMTGIGLQYLNQRDPDDVVRSIKNLDIPFDEDKTRSLLQAEKDKLMNRASVAAVSMVENSAKSFTEAGAIVNLAGAWALALPSKLLGDHKNATELVDTARQFQDRLRKSNKDAAIGSTLDAVFQTVQYVPEMARAKSELPKEEFDKLIKQPGATGELFVDPFSMAQVGTVMKLAMIPITSRVALNAERVLGKAAERVTRLSQIEVDLADLERARGLTQNSADIAKKTAEALRERYDLTGNQDLLRRANTAEDIFNGSSTKVAQFTNDGIRLSEEAAQLTAESQKLASRVPVVAAQKFEAAIKAGRDLKSVPFRSFASIIEPVGRGLVALDDGLDSVSKKLGIGAAYNLLTSKVGQAVGYGSAFGLGPVPALVGAAGSVLKSGPFLQRLADTSRIMGTEMAKAQSQMPFFQRVANNPMISPAHRSLAHLSDLATLGGFAPYIAKKAVKGTALSFPLDFAAEYMSEGGEVTPNTFKQAFAESLLIGGSSAALGGMFAGTQKRHQELSNNDESNFRNEITSPEQKQLFTNAPKFLRNAVGTFSAVFPSVNIELTQGGGGFHDDNTIGIDVNSSNPLKYLLAHEVKHLLVHRNQMHTPIVTMMLGDGEVGGIMRSPDGTLNPEFEAFAKEYNGRQIASGREPVSLGKIAEEFFVEAGVEDMAGMVESGELGAIASRTEARRMVGRLFNATLDKSTVLKDFHLKIGGLMDQGGKLVRGNGLLSTGITQTQEMRNMTRNMLSRAAGRAVGQFEPLGAANVGGKGEGAGINLPVNAGDKAMIEKIGPVEFEMETVNGRRQVARDASGDPIPIDFNTQLMRSRTGSLVQEAIGNRPSNYQYSAGEMNLNDEGVWEGYLPPDLIEQIKRKGALNQEQIRIIENVNSMIKNFKGDVALVINHPATSRNRKGKINYKTLKATLRQVTPISWNITKDGNLILGLMSVTQLKSNVDTRISSKTGQKLYQNNRAKLMVDVGRVMELHNKGQRTDSYFDEQYGAAKSQQYKNFVNSVFGLISKKQGEANPIFSEENLRSGNGVYKTYRADRISQATKMTGDKYPFQYDFVVQNMMPNGLPTLDDQGRPVAQNRLPEQTRQMPEGQAKPSYLPETSIKSQMDKMLENPPRIPNDLQKAWDIGYKTKDLSDSDAVNSGQVPDWVFNFGNDVNEFYEAGRRGETPEYVVGWRKGKIPESGRSKNYADSSLESGVSLAYAHNRTDMETSPMTMIGVSNRKKTYVSGWAFPKSKWGSDGEIVIVGANEFKPIKKSKSTVKVKTSPESISSAAKPSYLPEPVDSTAQDTERKAIGDDRVIDKGDAETLDVVQAINAKSGVPSWKDDKPVPVAMGYDLASAPHINKFAGEVENPSTAFLDDLPYDLNNAERKRVSDLITSGVVDRLANDMATETRVVLENPAIAAGKGWYSRMRIKLLNALGEDGRELFSQLLGATSAQTPVDENFQQAVDAYEGIKTKKYDRHREGYLTAVKAELDGTLNDEIAKSKAVRSIQEIIAKLKNELPQTTKKSEKIAIYAELKSLAELIEKPEEERTPAQRLRLYVIGNDLLPRRSNGAKFNANSGAVLKVISGVWLENRESPKTPNFAGNLSGRTVQATIDIWAARYIRRQIYGNEGNPWRIQPKSEVGVSKEDFAFSQIVMKRSADKLKMNPDDLQAILWFAEKDVWDKKGWTKNEGAKKSSFDDIFDVFFPEGKKPLSFAEGAAIIREGKNQEKVIAKAEKQASLKMEANALGVSITELNRMKKKDKLK